MDAQKSQGLRDIIKDKSLLREECYINGKWVGSDDKIDVTNPATGDVIASVPKLGKAETSAAIDAAEAAMKGWAAKPPRSAPTSCAPGST